MIALSANETMQVSPVFGYRGACERFEVNGLLGAAGLRCGSAGAEGESGDDAGVRGPGEVDEEGDGVGALLVSGAE